MSLFFRKDKNDKKGKWSDVFKSLSFVIVFYLLLRWITLEPYVIPSGSMIPTFLVQDYVLVKKWPYGVRIPFTEQWIVGPETPQRGDIVVFKSKEDDTHFLVKRVIGLPGDEVVEFTNGQLQVNGIDWEYADRKTEDSTIKAFYESNQVIRYPIQFDDNGSSEEDERQVARSFNVPEGEIFMMGDNRDHSMDSRYWGSLPVEKVMGKVFMIWMSCKESDKHSSFLCPAEDIRWDRMGLVR